MGERRVVITGLGAVTPAGVGFDSLWTAVMESRQCVSQITRIDASGFPCTIGAQVADFRARDFVPRSYRKAVKLMVCDIEMAVASADLAFKDAGIVTRGDESGAEMTVEPGRLGCNIGAGMINADLDELGAALTTSLTDGKLDLKLWGAEGMGNLTPLWLLKYLPNMLACHVTIIHGCEGLSNAVTCGDASGHLSIGEAFRWIARGEVDVAVAGGAESKLNAMGILRQSLLGRLRCSSNDDPASACRPFDAAHDGTVVGEGGCLLVLEHLDTARERGARIYAELVGFASASDPGGIDFARPTVGSLDLAAAGALKDAGITPREVDMVMAHGTGIPGQDVCEAGAWRAALGERLDDVPAFAITGSVGSMFACSGAAEMAVGAMAMSEQVVPPTVNFSTPADGCDIGVSARPEPGDFQYAVTGAFSVGGHSAACVLKRYDG